MYDRYKLQSKKNKMKVKSFVKSAALAAAILVVSNVSVSAKSKIAINAYMNSNLAVVSVLSPEADAFKIEITDNSGNTVYTTERVKNAATFQRLYDLSNLSDGKYVIKYDSISGSISENFEVKDSKVIK